MDHVYVNPRDKTAFRRKYTGPPAIFLFEHMGTVYTLQGNNIRTWDPSMGVTKDPRRMHLKINPTPQQLERGYLWWLKYKLNMTTWERDWEFHLTAANYVSDMHQSSIGRLSASVFAMEIQLTEGVRPDTNTEAELLRLRGTDTLMFKSSPSLYLDYPPPTWDDPCVICMCELEGDFRILGCQHAFHWPCIDQWVSTTLRGPRRCPSCRADIFTY